MSPRHHPPYHHPRLRHPKVGLTRLILTPGSLIISQVEYAEPADQASFHQSGPEGSSSEKVTRRFDQKVKTVNFLMGFILIILI